MKRALLCAVLGAAPMLVGAQPRVPAEQAERYVGQSVTVEGRVAQVSVARRSATTFLNFCEPYPRQCFVAVVFRSARSQFPDLRAAEGQTVRVSGTVSTYRGKPQIVLERSDQLLVTGAQTLRREP